jgi:hypothetical protein
MAMAMAPVAGADGVFDRQSWIADFEQLESTLTTGYPSLDWAVERGMDLPPLDQRTREKLAAADGDVAARAALAQFIASFADGHLGLSWAPVSPPGAAGNPTLCDRLGFSSSRPDTTAIVRGLSGYQALAPRMSPIAAGVVESGGRRIGVLRIAAFFADRAMCEATLREAGVDAGKPCDDACRKELESRVESKHVAEIAAGIRSIVEARPDVLMVDVAGNGGGNDSAIAAARMLTTDTLPTPRMQLVRGPAHAVDLAEDVAELRKALRIARGTEKTLLAGLVTNLEIASREANETCDLSPLWRGQPVDCSNLVAGPIYAAGYVDHELPSRWRRRPWAEVVSATARFEFTPAMWTGPLVVLVDGNSGSATELFAAMLQDADRALIVGAPTVGSGCGWTLPQQTTVLAHSGGRLTMPDCARRRRDGANELDGVVPAVMIPFRRFDTPAQRVRRLEAALPQVLPTN